MALLPGMRRSCSATARPPSAPSRWAARRSFPVSPAGPGPGRLGIGRQRLGHTGEPAPPSLDALVATTLTSIELQLSGTARVIRRRCRARFGRGEFRPLGQNGPFPAGVAGRRSIQPIPPRPRTRRQLTRGAPAGRRVAQPDRPGRHCALVAISGARIRQAACLRWRRHGRFGRYEYSWSETPCALACPLSPASVEVGASAPLDGRLRPLAGAAFVAFFGGVRTADVLHGSRV